MPILYTALGLFAVLYIMYVCYDTGYHDGVFDTTTEREYDHVEL